MTDLIGELRARRLVRELDPIRRPGAGRPTRPIDFDGEPWCVLGVHIDIDQVRFACTTVGGRELWSEDVRSDLTGSGPDAALAAFIDQLRAQLGRVPADSRMIAVEIAVPGYVTRDGGTVSWSPSLGWRDVDLAGAVELIIDETGSAAHVGVSNATQLAALHAARIELPLPPGSIVAYLGGNRAIDSGLIIDGEIFRGAAGGAGDFGHLSVETDADRGSCWCGRLDCLESVAGLRRLLTAGGLCAAAEAAQLVNDQPLKATQLLLEAANAGDPVILKTLEQTGATLGMAADDIIGMFNPHAVVLGGYLGALSGYLLPPMKARLGERLSIAAFADTQLLAVEQGVPREVAGATLAARDACFYDPMALTRPL